MSLGYLPVALRHQVRERAGKRCEYCLFAEEHAYFPHEPDHIIAERCHRSRYRADLALESVEAVGATRNPS